MSYEVKETRAFPRPAAELLAAAAQTVAALGGKRPGKSSGVAGQLEIEFHKAIGGTSFGNRVRLVIRVASDGPDRCTTSLEAYPIDPLGKPLAFGVLGEPARLVTRAFWQRLDAQLTPAAG
jgi:hypothetical protein